VREEPVISGGVIKVALVLLVAGALGVGGYALAGGGVDIDLPDLPDIETTTDEAIELGDTTIEEGVFEEGQGPLEEAAEEGRDPFTTTSFANALAQVREEVGTGAQLTRLFVNDVQTQLIVRRDDGVEVYSVRADSGELTNEEATITISGGASIEDFAFSLDAIEAESIDRMLTEARKQSGAGDFEPTVLSLERAILFGRRALEWTINAQGGGRNLLYRADADGSNVHSEGGKGTAIPPAAAEAEKLNECIEAAGDDPERIFACLDRFR
jgi:hypothetical protein